ncbi:MAG: polysaccharide deacetylase family protein [Spirochaetes bacterium]|nr:polysaccharide deacetylase family protein [Spirochaetota bacterium]
MRDFLCAMLIAILGGATLSAAPSSHETGLPPSKSILTVLCYHNIDIRSPKNSPYSVTSAQLTDELNALKAAGFDFVSLEQVQAFYASGKPLPSKSALITFDDGHENIYEHAYPILKKMNIPWLLFVFPTAIGGGHEKGFMNWDEVQQLNKEGVAIGSHSFDHPYLTRPGKEISTPEAYDAWLDKELIRSKRLIEDKLGSPVNAFASPFGALNNVVQQHIKNAGYSLAFNIFGSNNDALNNPLELNRIIVLSTHSPEMVVKKAEERPLHFTKEFPGSLQVYTGMLATAGFSLEGIDDYIPGSIQVLINGTRIETLKENGSSFMFDVPAPGRSKGYIVTVYARGRSGEIFSQSYYFIYATKKPDFLKLAPAKT